MSDELKLPQVGELTLPQWQDWLVRYNAVLNERERRIERLEAALRKIRAMHYEDGVNDLEERDDRTYCIVCDVLEGKDD